MTTPPSSVPKFRSLSALHGRWHAKHNLLVFTGLHHAAVALWTYARCQNQGSTGLTLPVMTNDVRLIELCCHRSTKRLLAVVDSFRRLTPVGWYSFTISKYHKTEYYLSDSDRTGPKKKKWKTGQRRWQDFASKESNPANGTSKMHPQKNCKSPYVPCSQADGPCSC